MIVVVDMDWFVILINVYGWVKVIFVLFGVSDVVLFDVVIGKVWVCGWLLFELLLLM